MRLQIEHQAFVSPLRGSGQFSSSGVLVVNVDMSGCVDLMMLSRCSSEGHSPLDASAHGASDCIQVALSTLGRLALVSFDEVSVFGVTQWDVQSARFNRLAQTSPSFGLNRRGTRHAKPRRVPRPVAMLQAPLRLRCHGPLFAEGRPFLATFAQRNCDSLLVWCPLVRVLARSHGGLRRADPFLGDTVYACWTHCPCCLACHEMAMGVRASGI